MEANFERSNLRVAPAHDAIVRRALDAVGMSLNEYDASRTVAAATTNSLADRQIFAVEPPAWDKLHESLNRPPAPNPRITALLMQPPLLVDV